MPEEHRRQAFSLDSMAVEVSFMAGPALAILMITQLGDAASTLRAVGVALALSAAVLWAYDPQVTGHEAAPEILSSRRSWLRRRFVLALGVAAAATTVVSGTEVSIVAVLRPVRPSPVRSSTTAPLLSASPRSA